MTATAAPSTSLAQHLAAFDDDHGVDRDDEDVVFARLGPSGAVNLTGDDIRQGGQEVTRLAACFDPKARGADGAFYAPATFQKGVVTARQGRRGENVRRVVGLLLDADLKDYVAHRRGVPEADKAARDRIAAELHGLADEDLRPLLGELQQEVRRALFAAGIAPFSRTATGYGFQDVVALAREDQEFPLARIKSAHAALIDALNAAAGYGLFDAAVKDSGSRLARLAGSFNRKNPDRPRLVREIEKAGVRLRLADLPRHPEAPVRTTAGPNGVDPRPGDAFNARVTWPEVLEPRGWRQVGTRGGVTYWRRPGKDRGVSATTNHAGGDLLHVFTSSTAFEPDRSYARFGAYALLEHGSDFAAAARALAALGFGTGASRPRDADDTADSADSEDAFIPWEAPVPLPEGERPQFPTHLLPEPLHAFVGALAEATQTPAALPALMVLATVAAAAAKRVAVRVRDGWTEPVNLYAVVALGSGNRKSAVVKEAVKPLQDHERTESRRLAAETARAETRRAIAEKALEKARNKAAAAEGDEFWRQREEAERLARDLVENADLQVPRSPRLLADDVTPEKLAAMMADNGGRMAVLSAEGGLFDIMAGRFSKDGRSPNLDLFLKAHAGDDLPVDRLGRPGCHLTAPALTLGLAVQDHVLRGLAARPNFRGTGLLARYTFAIPDSLVGRRRIGPEPVPPAVAAAYAAAVDAVLKLVPPSEEDGLATPRDVAFDMEAEGRMLRFEAALEPRLGPEGDLGHVADWGAKLAGLVARLAGLFHTVEHAAAGDAPWDHSIGADTIERAVALAEGFLVPHALTAFGEMGADPDLEAARLVLRVLERWDEPVFSRRDLHQRSLKRRFRRPEELDRPLALLVDHGYLRPCPSLAAGTERGDPTGAPPSKRPPGRPGSDRFEINPLWRPQNPQKPQKPEVEPVFEDGADIEDAVGTASERDDGVSEGWARAAAGKMEEGEV